jgi:endonuclease-3
MLVKASMNREKVAEIFKRFKKQRPAPKTELEFINDFTLLVAVVLSAQATDKGVNKATPALFKIAPTPEKMAALGENGIKQYIKTIGLFNAKAKNVYLLSKMLVEEYGGKVPADRDQLQRLPGVGRKTANVVLNCAFGQPTMAVDTHIFRVSNRIGLAKSKNPLQTEEQLVKVIPEEYLFDAHHWLILHGRYTCVARRPKCYECIIVDLCEFKDKNLIKKQ